LFDTCHCRFDEEDKYAHAALGALYSREDLLEFNIPMAVEHLEKVIAIDDHGP
jgi:hypothetical protein